jgi:hypothetical protein
LPARTVACAAGRGRRGSTRSSTLSRKRSAWSSNEVLAEAPATPVKKHAATITNKVEWEYLMVGKD